MVQQLSTVVYQCVVQEKADAIYPHFVLQQVCGHIFFILDFFLTVT